MSISRQYSVLRYLCNRNLAHHANDRRMTLQDNSGMPKSKTPDRRPAPASTRRRMNEIGPRIREIREQLKITLDHVAKVVGTDPINISRVERQIQGYSEAALWKYAKALGVDVASFFDPLGSPLRFAQADARGTGLYFMQNLPAGAHGGLQENAEPAPPLKPFRRVPVVGTAQLGDDGYLHELEYPAGEGDGYIEFPTNDPQAYAVRVRGDSMRPRIKNGEFVIGEPATAAVPGDEVIVKFMDGRKMVKELLYVRDGFIALGSINDAHPPINVQQKDVDSLHRVAAIIPGRSGLHRG